MKQSALCSLTVLILYLSLLDLTSFSLVLQQFEGLERGIQTQEQLY